MTLQQMADYAMRYLDTQKIAAEYVIIDGQLSIDTEKGRVFIRGNKKKSYVTHLIHYWLI